MGWWYPLLIDSDVIICWNCHYDFSRKHNQHKRECPNCGYEGKKEE